MDPATRARLEQVYAAHPLSGEAVLERIRQERGTLDGIRARDLAEAPHGGPTDQNHVGGASAVRDLARIAGAGPGSMVLDIGTGLGGTPRLLAEEFGCRCHGVELTRTRFADAVRLTRLVGLDDLVTFSQGDFMSVDVPGRPFDLAIMQGAVMHFPDLSGLLERIAGLCRPGGRLAIEDGVIADVPPTSAGKHELERLLHHWNGRFQRRDEWPALLERAGFRVDRMDDLTDLAIRDLDALIRDTRAGRLRAVTADEQEAWELGVQLFGAGNLGFARILATWRAGQR